MFDDLNIIGNYFELLNEIAGLKKELAELETVFYSQNMASRIEYSELGVVTRAFKVEKMVLEHIKAQEVLNNRIERHNVRYQYFTRYLKELPEKDYKRLYERFILNKHVSLPNGLVLKTLDEIKEIEACICLREGIEVDEIIPRIELTENFEDNMMIMSDLFAI